jgi:hypothetical protein
MWDAILTVALSILIIVAVFGYPIYWVYNKWLNKPQPKNYPFRKPSIFTNSFGQLIMVELDPYMQNRVQNYYKGHPKEARVLLNSLREDEKW